LVENNPSKQIITYSDYLRVEDWYLTEAIDKNIANIINKAKQYRSFLETLLFTDVQIPFEIDREEIQFLHVHGLLKKDENGNVEFWVPLYKKRLYNAFYPYKNEEDRRIKRNLIREDFFDAKGNFRISKLIIEYREYVKRRGFKVFMIKDKDGKYIGIRESALIYSFETFITAVVSEFEGKIYREADTGLGKSDLIINIEGKEFLVETKIFISHSRFEKCKRQLAYYCRSLGIGEGVYLVFYPNNLRYKHLLNETVEVIDEIKIQTYLVEYDEEKW
jgi:REP element-mobilizing transposase RayT